MCGWMQFLSTGLLDRYESPLQVVGVSKSTKETGATKVSTHTTFDLTIIFAVVDHLHRAKLTGSM